MNREELIQDLKYKKEKCQIEVDDCFEMLDKYGASTPKIESLFLGLIFKLIDWNAELERQITFLESYPRNRKEV
jgi:hypothetical protein